MTKTSKKTRRTTVGRRKKTATRRVSRRKSTASRKPRGASGVRLVLSLFFVVSASVWVVTMTAVGTMAFREIRGVDWDATKGPAMIVSENLGFVASFAPEAADRVVLGSREIFGSLFFEFKSSLASRFKTPASKETIVWRSWIRRYFALEPEIASPVIAAAPSFIEPALGPSSWVRSVEQRMVVE